MIGLLRKIEAGLQSAIEGGGLSKDDVQPLDLVRQIEREIERNKKAFINDQIYVPHKMVIHLYAPVPGKVEEYEALFNNAEFRGYLEQYIKEQGYTLLDRIRITVQCHSETAPEFRGRHCFVEFSWPQQVSDPGEMTVVLDPADERRIVSMQPTEAEVVQEAWLEVVEGDAYQARAKITRREFNIGRTENVLHHQTKRVLRVNHLAFKRPGEGDAINRSVSRQHGKIVSRGGAFHFYDTGSQNGSSILRGGSTILVPRGGAAGEGIALKDGDVLVLGRAKVRFRQGPSDAKSS